MTLDPMKLLPPGVRPFEAVLHPGGQMDIRGLDEEAQARQVAEALKATPLADVREDAALWRVRGLLIRGQAQLYEYAVAESGAVSGPDGEEGWEVRPFPEMPGVPVQGDGSAPNTFDALHYREGRIDLEPDAPDDLLDAVEDAVREYHGTEGGLPGQTWAERHAAAGGPASAVPEARRVRLRLDDAAGLRFVALPETAEYLHGGEWHAYAPAPQDLAPGNLKLGAPGDTDGDTDGDADEGTDEGTDEDSPFDLFSSLFDLHSVTAELHADGRVQVQGENLAPEVTDALERHLRADLGAGDPEKWQATLRELFGLESGDEVPSGLRVGLLRQMVEADPALAAQAITPSAVTFDGQTWTELDTDDTEDDE